MRILKSRTKESHETEKSVKQSKSGLFSKLRKSKSSKEDPAEQETLADQVHPAEQEEAPVLAEIESDDEEEESHVPAQDEKELEKQKELLEQQRNFVEERTTHFKASQVRTEDVKFHEGVSKNRPTAKESVTKGGMRYDWIDIETVAALKLQAAFRGNKCREDLINRGMTTSSMRNKMRERNAKHHVDPNKIASEDVPFFARFCGIGLLFGEADEGLTDYEKERLEKEKEKNTRKQQQLEREENLRSNYRKQKRMNAKETIEVTDE
jgi:hypothetical protein